jgi:hypothetical protein
MSTIDRIYERLNEDYAFNFFQITVYEDEEIDGVVHKNVRQRINESIVTTKNWEQHKDIFFNERMATYDESFPIVAKIKLELEKVEKLPVNEDKHKVLKDLYCEYLKAVPVDTLSEQNHTKKIIHTAFREMHHKGWELVFRTKEDYNLFTDLLTNFFEYKAFKLPENTIKIKTRTKTAVAKVLREIHELLSNENKLSTDIRYFELIKILSHFEKTKQKDLYKALTR